MKRDMSWAQARDWLLKRLSGLDFSLYPETWEQMTFYLEALEQKASFLNLTAVKSREERVRTQVLESLFLAINLPRGAFYCADLGSGAGIPGFLVKLIRPELKMLLLEALPKRVSFMQKIIKELGLSGIEAHTLYLGRDPWPGPFDIVLARGYGAVTKFTSHAAQCLRPRGQAFYLWRKDCEPWGKGPIPLRFEGQKELVGCKSPLLCWQA